MFSLWCVQRWHVHFRQSLTLGQAAEAYMSLGNVSSTRVNEQYFHEALEYLCIANEIADYVLPAHLKQYATSVNV
jgi:hypothetical protein